MATILSEWLEQFVQNGADPTNIDNWGEAAGGGAKFPLITDPRFENVRYFDTIGGLKVEIDYEEYANNFNNPQWPSGIFPADSEWRDYKEAHILSISRLNIEHSDYSGQTHVYLNDNTYLLTYLQFDDEGNVWAHFVLDNMYDITEESYYELASQIQVATAQDLQNPDFTFPVVRFEIPTNIDVISDMMIMGYCSPGTGYDNSYDCYTKVSK